MARPGEVWGFWSEEASKRKWHVCVSLEGCFLFLNSPKLRPFPGEFTIDNADVPFLPPTENGQSIISCSIVIRMTDDELKAAGGQCYGDVDNALLRRLLPFLQTTPTLVEEDREAVTEGLLDWLGV